MKDLHFPTSDLPVAPRDPLGLRHAVEAAGVVRLDAADMTPAGLVDLLKTLGEPMFTLGETPVDSLPDLNIVTNKGRTTKPRSVFHSDTTYVTRPPSFSALIAVDVPEAGGATLFTDQVAACDLLDHALRDLLRGATMRHEVTGVELPDGAEREARHPVLRRHAGTGRTALFLTTPARCSQLRLADGTDRSDLIEVLYDHSLTNAPRVAHRWREGDVVIWDNRSTLHAADHSAVVGDRTLYRGMIRGEAPLAA
jgi:taurine dioxygenase